LFFFFFSSIFFESFQLDLSTPKKWAKIFLGVRQKYLRRTIHTRRVVGVGVLLLLRLARDDADDDDDDDDDDDGDEPWRQREGGRGGSIGTPSDYVRDILLLLLLYIIFADDNKTIEEEEDVHDDDDDASTKNGKLSMSIDCIIGIITDVIVDDHRGRWPGNVHREARDGIVRRERRGTRLGGFWREDGKRR